MIFKKCIVCTHEQGDLHFPSFIHPFVCSFIRVTVTVQLPWAFKVACFFNFNSLPLLPKCRNFSKFSPSTRCSINSPLRNVGQERGKLGQPRGGGRGAAQREGPRPWGGQEGRQGCVQAEGLPASGRSESSLDLGTVIR